MKDILLTRESKHIFLMKAKIDSGLKILSFVWVKSDILILSFKAPFLAKQCPKFYLRNLARLQINFVILQPTY